MSENININFNPNLRQPLEARLVDAEKYLQLLTERIKHCFDNLDEAVDYGDRIQKDEDYLYSLQIGGVGEFTDSGHTSERFNDYTYNEASGKYAHAEGSNTHANANYSHAEGSGNVISDTGTNSHIEGNGNSLTAPYSHIEGHSNATINATFAQGIKLIPTLVHIEGENNEASSWEDSTGKYHFLAARCHIEGKDNKVKSNDVFCSGSSNEVWAQHCFVAGTMLRANTPYCATFGMYNNNYTSHRKGSFADILAHPENYNIFEVGNGTDDDKRNTCFWITADGVAHFNSMSINDNPIDFDSFVTSDDIKDFVTKDVNDLTNYTTTASLESNYAKKSDIPVVPSKVSAFENDAQYITLAEVPVPDVPTKTSELENDSGFITEDDIPAIPSKVSQLQNDSGFITGNSGTNKRIYGLGFAAQQSESNANSLIVTNSLVTKGAELKARTFAGGVTFFDNKGTAPGNSIGTMRTAMETSGNVTTYMSAFANVDGSTTNASLSIICKQDGTGYATCPTPPATANGTQIATASWVRNYADKVVAVIGTNNGGTGWYKVADGTPPANSDNNFVFIIRAGWTQEYLGIIDINIHRGGTHTVVQACKWIYRDGFAEDSIRIVIDANNKWTMYVYNPSATFGRVVFTCLSSRNHNGAVPSNTITYYNSTVPETNVPSDDNHSVDGNTEILPKLAYSEHIFAGGNVSTQLRDTDNAVFVSIVYVDGVSVSATLPLENGFVNQVLPREIGNEFIRVFAIDGICDVDNRRSVDGWLTVEFKKVI